MARHRSTDARAPGGALGLNVGQFSHPGRQRSNNEDWLGTFQPVDAKRLDEIGSLFVVADGMGGHQSGELASRFAVDQVIRMYVDDPTGDVMSSLRRSIESANAALHAESERRHAQTVGRGWGTTLVAAVVQGDQLWIANVGDSRAYLLRNGRLEQLSEDHVLFPSEGPGAGLAGRAMGRHLITRALGRKSAIEVDVFPPRKLRNGDRVLLCTDGLTTPLSDGEIRQIAAHHPPQKAAEALVRAANERGGPDNVSVILFEVVEEGPRSVGEALQDIWHTLADPQFWRKVPGTIEQNLPGSAEQSRTLLLVVLVGLVILVLAGLGFILGIILL